MKSELFSAAGPSAGAGWGGDSWGHQDRGGDSPGRCVRGRRGGSSTRATEASSNSILTRLAAPSLLQEAGESLFGLGCCSSQGFLGEERRKGV